MIPRIKNIKAQDNFILNVTFDDDVTVLYDVKDDIKEIPDFKLLET